jgi:hypothetical protein
MPFNLLDISEDGKLRIAEFKLRVSVISSFLRSSQYRHTVVANINKEDLDHIKTFTRTASNHPENKQWYRWPFTGMQAKFTSKDNPAEDFPNIWDRRDILDLDNVDLRLPLRPSDVDAGTNVLIEYAVIPYLGQKESKDNPAFDPGCTLSLLSVGVLRDDQGDPTQPQFDFDSPSKRQLANR